LVFVSVAAAGTAHAGTTGGAPQDGYWTCETKGSESTIYASGAFEAKSTVDAMDKAFSDALKMKYGFAGRILRHGLQDRHDAGCDQGGSASAIMQQRGDGRR
jgi:hypothetical protein